MTSPTRIVFVLATCVSLSALSGCYSTSAGSDPSSLRTASDDTGACLEALVIEVRPTATSREFRLIDEAGLQKAWIDARVKSLLVTSGMPRHGTTWEPRATEEFQQQLAKEALEDAAATCFAAELVVRLRSKFPNATVFLSAHDPDAVDVGTARTFVGWSRARNGHLASGSGGVSTEWRANPATPQVNLVVGIEVERALSAANALDDELSYGNILTVRRYFFLPETDNRELFDPESGSDPETGEYLQALRSIPDASETEKVAARIQDEHRLTGFSWERAWLLDAPSDPEIARVLAVSRIRREKASKHAARAFGRRCWQVGADELRAFDDPAFALAWQARRQAGANADPFEPLYVEFASAIASRIGSLPIARQREQALMNWAGIYVDRGAGVRASGSAETFDASVRGVLLRKFHDAESRLLSAGTDQIIEKRIRTDLGPALQKMRAEETVLVQELASKRGTANFMTALSIVAAGAATFAQGAAIRAGNYDAALQMAQTTSRLTMTSISTLRAMEQVLGALDARSSAMSQDLGMPMLRIEIKIEGKRHCVEARNLSEFRSKARGLYQSLAARGTVTASAK